MDRTTLFDLAGRTALITGATGGLGKEIVLTYAALGAKVVVSDLDQTRCERVVDEIRGQGGQAIAQAADLSDRSSVDAMLDAALAQVQVIDSLVCCGGMEGAVGTLLDVSDAAWTKLMEVNLHSALWMTQKLAPGMKQQGGGNITFIASIAGLRGNKMIGLYGIAKAGLSQLARNLAVDLGPDGIRVNCVAPGLVETPLSAAMLTNETFMARRMSLTPLRRVGQPYEIAGLTAMLASRAGGFITGQTLVADGGTLITDGN